MPPMMPRVWPDPISRLMSESTFLPAERLYTRSTCSKRTSPFFTSITGSAGSAMSVFSLRTSTIRSAEEPAMVIMANTMDSIIRLERVWMA